MASQPFKSRELFDFLRSFTGGMNAGVDPSELPRSVLASLINGSVRGTYAGPRPVFRKINLTFPDTDTQAGATTGLWQGGTYYKADNGEGSLFAAVSGRLFQLTPDAAGNATVVDKTGANSQSSTAPIEWLWQAENFIIWNDAINNPVVFDGLGTTRVVSNNTVYGTVTENFTIPAPGFTFTLKFTGSVPVGALVYYDGFVAGFPFKYLGNNTFLNVNSPPATITNTPQPLNSSPGGANVGGIPIGKMGAYGMGRNWICLTDGVSFVASDIVGGSSGTAKYNFRDAVLQMTENTFLNGGGSFRVPSSGSSITAMIFASTLDASLGQGPLQVFTEDTVFSCNAPVDRTTWQNLTNPILTESLIGSGAEGQDSTVAANGDTLFRSVVGFGSLILGRRDFNTWGNVPISTEVNAFLDPDDKTLLQYGSGIIFDNRWLETQNPIQGPQGVYHTGIVAMNFDPISSLRGKAPSVYDGLWNGLNVLRLITGKFSGIQRAFAFCYNADSPGIELWEIMPSDTTMTLGNGTAPIVVDLTSAVLDFGQKDIRDRDFKRLLDGEVYIDEITGPASFQAFYKPDRWPNWVPWYSFTVTPQGPTGTDPGYRPSLGLGEPDATVFDNVNNMPLREAFDFQFRLVFTNCRFKGARFSAATIPSPAFAPAKANG